MPYAFASRPLEEAFTSSKWQNLKKILFYPRSLSSWNMKMRIQLVYLRPPMCRNVQQQQDLCGKAIKMEAAVPWIYTGPAATSPRNLRYSLVRTSTPLSARLSRPAATPTSALERITGIFFLDK